MEVAESNTHEEITLVHCNVMIWTVVLLSWSKTLRGLWLNVQVQRITTTIKSNVGGNYPSTLASVKITALIHHEIFSNNNLTPIFSQ